MINHGILWRAALALLGLLASVVAAAAHASLTASEPRDGSVVQAAPAILALSFSEPVSPLSLALVKPDGSSVPLTGFVLRDRTVEIEAPSGLGTGTHVLSWRVVSEDGHPVGGSVIFSIGEPSAEAPQIEEGVDWQVRSWLWASKVALYAGLFFGVGGVFSRRIFLPDIDGGGRVAAVALAFGIAGAVLSLGFQGLDALGAPMGSITQRAVWSAGLGTSYGYTVIVALAAGVLAAIGLSASGMLGQVSAVAALLGVGLALASSGHASAASPQWLMRPTVFLHAVAIVVWIGALPPLALAMLRREEGRVTALKRFSAVIPAVLAVLVIAGVVLAVVQVERPAALCATAYGSVLLIKLFLLLCLFVLAAVNRWRLTARAMDGKALAERRLVRSILAETLLVLLILGAVAAWRFTPPPRALAAAAAQPATTHLHGAKAMADVSVAPGRTGPVAVSAIIMTGDFAALDAKEVTFVFSNPAAGIEPFKRKAEKPGDGTWRADDVILPLPGDWHLRIDILVTDFDLVRLEGEIGIRP
jgi:copper transport protein